MYVLLLLCHMTTITITPTMETGVSNRWNGTMEWNSKYTQLQLTHVHVTGTAQRKLNYLVYLWGCYLIAEAL